MDCCWQKRSHNDYYTISYNHVSNFPVDKSEETIYVARLKPATSTSSAATRIKNLSV